MSISGWITMFLSVGFTTGFFAWTIYKVLTVKDTSHLHSVYDVDTHDIED